MELSLLVSVAQAKCAQSTAQAQSAIVDIVASSIQASLGKQAYFDNPFRRQKMLNKEHDIRVLLCKPCAFPPSPPRRPKGASSHETPPLSPPELQLESTDAGLGALAQPCP